MIRIRRRVVLGVLSVVASMALLVLAGVRTAAQRRLPPPVVAASSGDLGDVFTPDSVPFSVTIRNTSDRSVQVVKAETSCGCTTVAGSQRFRIPPLGQHAVNLVYDSSGRRGEQQLVLKVFAAGYGSPSSISTRVNVVSQYPDAIEMPAMRVDRVVATEATVLHRPGLRLALRRVVYDRKLLRVSSRSTTEGDAVLCVRPVAERTRERFFTKLVLWTNDPVEPKREIPVSGQVLPELLVMPDGISVDILRPDETVSKALRVWSPYQRRFRIRAIHTGTETVRAL